MLEALGRLHGGQMKNRFWTGKNGKWKYRHIFLLFIINVGGFYLFFIISDMAISENIEDNFLSYISQDLQGKKYSPEKWQPISEKVNMVRTKNESKSGIDSKNNKQVLLETETTSSISSKVDVKIGLRSKVERSETKSEALQETDYEEKGNGSETYIWNGKNAIGSQFKDGRLTVKKIKHISEEKRKYGSHEYDDHDSEYEDDENELDDLNYGHDDYIADDDYYEDNENEDLYNLQDEHDDYYYYFDSENNTDDYYFENGTGVFPDENRAVDDDYLVDFGQTLNITGQYNLTAARRNKKNSPDPWGDASALNEMDVINLFQPGALPLKFVMDCVNYFKEEKILSDQYVKLILKGSTKYLNTLPTVLDVAFPHNSNKQSDQNRITVVGDTHGQFYDLLKIFEINGYPSMNNPYVFTGDFVDRGSFGVEVLLTLLLFKLSCPECIHLLRGNHEVRNMNAMYGFRCEVLLKYNENFLKKFGQLYHSLPLAAVIDKKIFVVHGGLSRNSNVTTIESIKGLKRQEGGNGKDLWDFLWSDTREENGFGESERGEDDDMSFTFGPDVTKEFLEKNDLNMVVRSHDVRYKGYSIEHGGDLVTIFSAPNYNDYSGNLGSFVQFNETLEPNFIQFGSSPHPELNFTQFGCEPIL
uniref:Serine/threonine-protein phosphatase n=1 Tax=Corethron hystrix TaxID=216773 RepID=A0A7S1BDI8_9STRA|mmetsp:Transcript_22660/g.51927  ORF Transcript_22660/g.51927 Transcript_22660/m.51927 type:complete len:644 (+) Transcript_22660:182-2113(+)